VQVRDKTSHVVVTAGRVEVALIKALDVVAAVGWEKLLELFELHGGSLTVLVRLAKPTPARPAGAAFLHV